MRAPAWAWGRPHKLGGSTHTRGEKQGSDQTSKPPLGEMSYIIHFMLFLYSPMIDYAYLMKKVAAQAKNFPLHKLVLTFHEVNLQLPYPLIC